MKHSIMFKRLSTTLFLAGVLLLCLKPAFAINAADYRGGDGDGFVTTSLFQQAEEQWALIFHGGDGIGYASLTFKAHLKRVWAVFY